MKYFIGFIVLAIITYFSYYRLYLPNLDVNKMDVSDIDGNKLFFPADKPYILCYIQSWCHDCIAETPCLVSFSEVNDIPVYFVTDETEEYMKRYRSRFDFDLKIYYAKEKFKEHGILQFPSAYFFDVNHKMIDFKQERIDSAVLSQFLLKVKR